MFNAAPVVTDSSRVGGFWYKHTGLSFFFFVYIMSIKAKEHQPKLIVKGN